MGDKRYRLDWSFFCHGMNMSGDSIPSGKAIGGSETAAIQLAETLAKQGHRPIVFCNAQEQQGQNGVQYLPIGWVQQKNGSSFPKGFFDYVRSTPHDVLVVMRLPGILQWEFKSKVNFLWQHDLATKTGPSNFHATCWNIDRVLLPSAFMKAQYQEVHGGPDALYHVTRNGIDLGLIDSVPEQERDRFKVMFTSRPERGLDIMLQEVFPRILKREPKATLHISRYDDVATLPLYQECARMAQQFGDRVVNLGNLGKTDLYKHYKQARVYAYSSVFEEISMITLAEFSACGGAFVGPWKAALPEHMGGAPVLVRDDGSIGRIGDPLDKGLGPVSAKFCDRMADEVVDLIRNDERWETLSKAGRKRAEKWTWDEVAEDWARLAHELIGQRTSEPKRVAKHFLVNSDVVAAKRYADHLNDDRLRKSVKHYIDRFVPFMTVEDEAERKQAIATFYEERSGGEAAVWQTAFWADAEPRTKVLIDWIAQHKDEVGSVLDFGCAHGGYARALSNAFSSLRVLGADVSPTLIRCAKELRVAKMPDGNPACAHPDNLSFVIGDEDTDILDTYDGLRDGIDSPRQFDLVVAMEVLEHLPNAEEVAKKLERHCKPGGWMCFTTPHGHRERDEFVTKGVMPVHVRSFDKHDLMDIFGNRDGFHVVAFSDFKELDYDRTFAGWFMIFYKNDGKPLGEIDWERKFFLQGPRETLSVCMITNNCEATLHRALKSIHKIADQIIVVDNGPSQDSTVEIAKRYTDDVRLGTSPFWCYAHKMRHPQDQILPGVCDIAGFETPRNESTQGAWGDFIFWIDSVTGDTPVPVRRTGSRFFEYMEIRDLIPQSLRERQHRIYKRSDYEVLTHLGWQRIKWVMQHRGTKQLFRVIDSDGEVRVTEDHSLMSNGEAVRGADVTIGLSLDHKFINHSDAMAVETISPQLAEAWGFFAAEGSALIGRPKAVIPKNSHWRSADIWTLNNTNITLIERYRQIYETAHTRSFYVVTDNKGDKYKPCYKLWPRQPKDLALSYRRLFYSDAGRKKIPREILNGKVEIQRAFLRGYELGDGHIRRETKDGRSLQSFCTNSPLLAAGLLYLYRTAEGREFFCQSRKDKPHIIQCAERAGVLGTWGGRRRQMGVRQIIPMRAGKEWVYDLHTDAGTFIGGVGDFVLHNSDENLLNWQHVWQYLRPNSYLGYAVNQHHLSVDPPGSLKKDIPVRLYRNHQGMKFFGTVHEHAELAINAGVGPHVVVLPLDIHHDGYLTEPIRRGRFARNIKLLECDRLKYPDRMLGIYLYDVRDNIHMARYQMERNGGVVDEQVQRYAWHAIETFRKHFLGKDVMLAQDGINYYSDALHLLGIGVEMAIDLDVRREGAHLNGGVLRFRVADYNEAKLVTDQLLRQRFGPFEGRYVS